MSENEAYLVAMSSDSELNSSTRDHHQRHPQHQHHQYQQQQHHQHELDYGRPHSSQARVYHAHPSPRVSSHASASGLTHFSSPTDSHHQIAQQQQQQQQMAHQHQLHNQTTSAAGAATSGNKVNASASTSYQQQQQYFQQQQPHHQVSNQLSTTSCPSSIMSSGQSSRYLPPGHSQHQHNVAASHHLDGQQQQQLHLTGPQQLQHQQHQASVNYPPQGSGLSRQISGSPSSLANSITTSGSTGVGLGRGATWRQLPTRPFKQSLSIDHQSMGQYHHHNYHKHQHPTDVSVSQHGQTETTQHLHDPVPPSSRLDMEILENQTAQMGLYDITNTTTTTRLPQVPSSLLSSPSNNNNNNNNNSNNLYRKQQIDISNQNNNQNIYQASQVPEMVSSSSSSNNTTNANLNTNLDCWPSQMATVATSVNSNRMAPSVRTLNDSHQNPLLNTNSASSPISTITTTASTTPNNNNRQQGHVKTDLTDYQHQHYFQQQPQQTSHHTTNSPMMLPPMATGNGAHHQSVTGRLVKAQSTAYNSKNNSNPSLIGQQPNYNNNTTSKGNNRINFNQMNADANGGQQYNAIGQQQQQSHYGLAASYQINDDTQHNNTRLNHLRQYSSKSSDDNEVSGRDRNDDSIYQYQHHHSHVNYQPATRKNQQQQGLPINRSNQQQCGSSSSIYNTPSTTTGKAGLGNVLRGQLQSQISSGSSTNTNSQPGSLCNSNADIRQASACATVPIGASGGSAGELDQNQRSGSLSQLHQLPPSSSGYSQSQQASPHHQHKHVTARQFHQQQQQHHQHHHNQQQQDQYVDQIAPNHHHRYHQPNHQSSGGTPLRKGYTTGAQTTSNFGSPDMIDFGLPYAQATASMPIQISSALPPTAYGTIMPSSCSSVIASARTPTKSSTNIQRGAHQRGVSPSNLQGSEKGGPNANQAPGLCGGGGGTRSESSGGLPKSSSNSTNLTKKSNSTTQLSMTGTKKRLGFRKKQVTSFSVHRSEEVAPLAARHLVKQGSSMSEGDSSMSGDSSRGSLNMNFKPPTSEELASMSFIDGLGKGQMISRQGLASPYLGDLQMSLCDRRGNLEVEVIRARNLQTKTHKIQPLTYVKLYLVKNRKCLAKAKTTLSSTRTLDPLFQQQLTFHEDYRGCILQAIVWGNFGKIDKKNFMGITQISIDDLELAETVISWYKLFLPSSLQTAMPSKSLRSSLLSNSTESFTNANLNSQQQLSTCSNTTTPINNNNNNNNMNSTTTSNQTSGG